MLGVFDSGELGVAHLKGGARGGVDGELGVFDRGKRFQSKSYLRGFERRKRVSGQKGRGTVT